MSAVAQPARRLPADKVLLHVAMVLAVIITLGPFVWIALSAFKTQIVLLMGDITFSPVSYNFDEVLFHRRSTYPQNFLNSLIVASVSTMLVIVIAFLAGYSLLRMNWPRWVLNAFLVWAMLFNLVPPVSLASAWYELFRTVNLSIDLIALTLAHTTLNLPMALWLLIAFFREVPKELEEAAFVDGARFLTLLRRVIVPVMMPGIVAVAVLVFIFSWNEFPVALALTNNKTATVPVAIAKFVQEEEIKYTQMAAASVLSAIPALLALIFGQRFIVKGLTAGAVK